MPRTRFEVSKAGERWAVKHGRDVVSEHPTKSAAVEAGRSTARATPNSQLVIKKVNGRIQEERTYGNDPRRTKG